MTDAAAADILTRNVGETVRRAQARDLAAGVVQAVFRVVKLSTLHAIDNQAMVRQVDETVVAIQDYGQRTDQNLSILFSHGSVFVGGQLLKANRSTYEGALELGETMSRLGACELHVNRDVRAADFYAFASVLADAIRSPKPTPIERPSPRIRLRPVQAAALREQLSDRSDANRAIVRMYASAVVIMRRFYEDVARGRYVLPQRVKRIAQHLVDLSAGETPAFLGVTSVRNANHDEAGRAVNTAILAVAMTRQITEDPVTLVRVAMSAMLHDCARWWVLGITGASGGIVPQLSEQQDGEIPGAAAAIMTALGRVNEPGVIRTVITYEAHWTKRAARLGPIYRGLRQPVVQARIVALARAFNDLLTPAPGMAPMSADEAIAALEHASTDPADRTVIRLLVSALGVFPTGTLVELSTGEVALVVRTSADPSLYSQPCVRLVFDATGGALQHPVELDLARRPAHGEPRRFIRKVVATSDDPGSAHLRALAVTPAPAVGTAASGVREPGAARTPSFPPPATAPPRARQEPTPGPTARPAGPAQQDQSTQAMQWSDQSHLLSQAGSATSRPPDSQDLRATVRPNEASPRPAVETRRAPPPPDSSPPPQTAPPSSQTAPPAPTAAGDLVRTPLVHLLVYMLDQRLTGTTVLQAPDAVTHGVFFADGVPAKIRTGAVIQPLDRVILDLGLLDENTLRSSLLEISKTKQLHGRHLVSKGLLDADTILSVLRVQLVRKMMHLFELPPETRYAYYEGQNLLARYGGPELAPCEPLAVIMAGVRLRADDPLVDATLERIADRPLGLHPGADVRRFELQKHEQAVIDVIRTRRMTLGEVLNSGVGHERVVRLTIYALAITRHLDLGLGGRSPVGIASVDGGGVAVPQRTVAIREAPEPASPPPPASRQVIPASSVHTKPTPPVGWPAAATPTAASENVAAMPRRPAADKPNRSSDPNTPGPKSVRTGIGMTFGAPGANSAPTVVPPGGTPTESPAAPRTGSSPPTSPGRPSAVPRAPMDLDARRREIGERAEDIDSLDYFTMLGVARDATHEQIQAAYFALAKAWHPDRQPAELADLKTQVGRVFARINEAYQTLTDAARRADYLRVLAQGGGTPDDQEKVQRVVDAALEFQKAEILLKKNDLAAAETLASRALAADPEQPEYLTTLVWIQAQRRGDPPGMREGQTTNHFDDLIHKLDLVIGKEPRYERALYFRGMLLKRSARHDRAIRDFRLVAEINPRNIDAVREVRVYDMRKRGGPEAQAGLFGKLFKK